MISLGMEMDLHVSFRSDDTVPIEDELDGVMEHLVSLVGTDCGLDDPSLAWDGGNYIVTVQATVTAADWQECAVIFDSCVRAAIHAAGGRTPGWTVEKRAQHAELVDA